MKYLSVCSGIEAATVAWHPLGWEPVGFSEIEPFPSAVLAHHYPNVTNFGDMTKYREWNIGTDRLDLLVGGTPCQSFSVAGLRKGLEDPRGNLALVYCGMLDHFRPQWFVWENVPGVLSSSGGRDFGSFLGAVAELGYGFAYRVLDAQFFGVAQRRRRVFVVGYLGDWRPPASVLFERQSLRRDTAPCREKRKVTPTLSSSGTGVSRVGFNCEDEWFIEHTKSNSSHWDGPNNPHPTLNQSAKGSGGVGASNQEVFSQRGAYLVQQPFEIANCLTQRMHKGINTTVDEGQTPIIAFENNRRDGARIHGEVTQTLQAFSGTGGGNTPMVCHGTQDPCVSDIAFAMGINNSGENVLAQPIPFDTTQITSPLNYSKPNAGDPCHPLASTAHVPAIASHMAVRRLTPVECERLQGFPDHYTNIPWRKKEESPDGPRYKALGNSMAVPCMHWIGKRIDEHSRLL